MTKRETDRANGVAMQCGLAAAWSLSLDIVSLYSVLEPSLFPGEIRTVPQGKNRPEPCYSNGK